MATECIKNCCKIFITQKEEPEAQVIKIRAPPKPIVRGDGKRSVGVSEDYLLSKLPSDGKEIPFVLPTLKSSYIQPRGSQYPIYQTGPQSSARATYADKKAELAGTSNVVYNPDMTFHPGQAANYVSPGSARRPTMKRGADNLVSALDKSGRQRLSNSMFDLSTPSHPHMQRYDSVSSVLSSTSSVWDSFGSNRSLESITLSGDERDKEREPGKVCVQLSYQEAVEQVWITLVQCKDVHVPSRGSEQPRFGIKGLITVPKPVQFKSSVKEAFPDVVFMETFVFTLNLQQLRSSTLLLRLQAHTPRRRPLGECVLALRGLGPQETQHWLELRPPSKTHKCHAELQLATCFQPVNNRIQLQLLSAQNLPSSSLLGLSFFVKVEMFSKGRLLLKRKTRVLKWSGGGLLRWDETLHFPLSAHDQDLQLVAKLYSRGSVRRKHYLGQVHLGFDSPSLEASEQWRESIAHPEKVVVCWHRLTHGP